MEPQEREFRRLDVFDALLLLRWRAGEFMVGIRGSRTLEHVGA